MDRGALSATVHGVAKSWTQLSDFTSLSMETEPHAAIAVDLQQPWRVFRVE